MLSGNEKQSLIRRLKNGDALAVDQLVELYGKRLFVTASWLCGNKADAQDLMIETLHEALVSIGSFREESSLFSWLYGILANLSRMSARKNVRSRLIYVDRLPDIPAEGPHAGQRIDDEEAFTCLTSAINSLSQAHQDVVLLRFFDNYSVQEIADALNVSPGTVKSRMYYAIRELKNILPKEMNLFHSAGN